MTRATSKASLLEERETGRVMSQEDKILEIISIGGDWSLKEIKAAFTAKWGDIETSSVSARCHSLKEGGKIFEQTPRKCAVSGKTINPLSANKCNHSHYKTKHFMQFEKAQKDPNICWTGMIEKTCKDCGMDIEFARRVEVKTVEQYKRSLG